MSARITVTVNGMGMDYKERLGALTLQYAMIRKMFSLKLSQNDHKRPRQGHVLLDLKRGYWCLEGP